ncbi:MAG: hypothetical protein PVI57_12585 [Gemmatimonadota bacterium]|jgi:hypothetical protein
MDGRSGFTRQVSPLRRPVTGLRIAATIFCTAAACLATGYPDPPNAGPGDPTTVFLDGFGNVCRLAFDERGDLFLNDGGVLHRVRPDGTRSVFTDEVPDARGFTFDAFGDLLVASPGESAIFRVSPAAQVSVFTEAFNVRSLAVGPDGSVWASAVDTVHHFDAAGRLLEKVDVRSGGGAAFGLQVSPAGDLHFSSFAGLWKLESGVPVALLTERPLRNRGFAFDADGNIYWTREAVEEGDTDRVILYDPSGVVVHDTIIGEVEDPCLSVFVRDEDGVTTERLLVAQLNGTIVEANSAGLPAGGWPVVPLSLSDIEETDCADGAAGIGGLLSEDVSRFLDAVGNANGSYDVGDFRAFLLATGTLQE